MLYSYKKLELALEGIAEECTGYQTKNGAVDVNTFPAGRTPLTGRCSCGRIRADRWAERGVSMRHGHAK